MSTLQEIEQAARQLPASEQAILVQRLQGSLQTPAERPAVSGQGSTQENAVKWPDIEVRLHAIFGDKVIPNLVLEERESADR